MWGAKKFNFSILVISFPSIAIAFVLSKGGKMIFDASKERKREAFTAGGVSRVIQETWHSRNRSKFIFSIAFFLVQTWLLLMLSAAAFHHVIYSMKTFPLCFFSINFPFPYITHTISLSPFSIHPSISFLTHSHVLTHSISI